MVKVDRLHVESIKDPKWEQGLVEKVCEREDKQIVVFEGKGDVGVFVTEETGVWDTVTQKRVIFHIYVGDLIK